MYLLSVWSAYAGAASLVYDRVGILDITTQQALLCINHGYADEEMGEERDDDVESVGVDEDEQMESPGDDNVELAGVDEDEQMMESPAFGNADTSTGEGVSGNQKRRQKCKMRRKNKRCEDRLTKEV